MDEHTQQRKRVIRRSYPYQASTIEHDTQMAYHSSSTTNPQSQQPKEQRVVYVRKKPEGLMCNICEGPAHGYNFNAITCESCKAFFRRNALKPHGKFKCRIDNGQCVINIATRKRCKACRLTKCFEKGMRADWILTDEERVNKRQKIEENRRLRQTLYPDSPDPNEPATMESIDEYEENNDNNDSNDDDKEKLLAPSLPQPIKSSPDSFLSVEDLMRIEQIQRAYVDSVRLTCLPSDVPAYPHTARISATSDMMNFPANIQATRLITYFKLLPEFSSLNEQDKLILIKYNTFTLTFLRAALNYDPLTDRYHEPDTDDCVFEGRDLIVAFSLYHYERSTRCVRNLLNASQGSAICTYIDEAEPVAESMLSIYQAQNIFIDLLWRYCEKKFGLAKTPEIFLNFIASSMDAHVQSYNIRQGCVKVDAVADQLSPLMKSVMLII